MNFSQHELRTVESAFSVLVQGKSGLQNLETPRNTGGAAREWRRSPERYGFSNPLFSLVGRHGEHDGFRFLQQIPKLDVFRRLVVVPFNFVHGFSLAPEATVRICELTPQCSSEISYFSSLATTSLDLF
jgi:hypothetical protein